MSGFKNEEKSFNLSHENSISILQSVHNLDVDKLYKELRKIHDDPSKNEFIDFQLIRKNCQIDNPNQMISTVSRITRQSKNDKLNRNSQFSFGTLQICDIPGNPSELLVTSQCKKTNTEDIDKRKIESYITKNIIKTINGEIFSEYSPLHTDESNCEKTIEKITIKKNLTPNFNLKCYTEPYSIKDEVFPSDRSIMERTTGNFKNTHKTETTQSELSQYDKIDTEIRNDQFDYRVDNYDNLKSEDSDKINFDYEQSIASPRESMQYNPNDTDYNKNIENEMLDKNLDQTISQVKKSNQTSQSKSKQQNNSKKKTSLIKEFDKNSVYNKQQTNDVKRDFPHNSLTEIGSDQTQLTYSANLSSFDKKTNNEKNNLENYQIVENIPSPKNTKQSKSSLNLNTSENKSNTKIKHYNELKPIDGDDPIIINKSGIKFDQSKLCIANTSNTHTLNIKDLPFVPIITISKFDLDVRKFQANNPNAECICEQIRNYDAISKTKAIKQKSKSKQKNRFFLCNAKPEQSPDASLNSDKTIYIKEDILNKNSTMDDSSTNYYRAPDNFKYINTKPEANMDNTKKPNKMSCNSIKNCSIPRNNHLSGSKDLKLENTLVYSQSDKFHKNSFNNKKPKTGGCFGRKKNLNFEDDLSVDYSIDEDQCRYQTTKQMSKNMELSKAEPNVGCCGTKNPTKSENDTMMKNRSLESIYSHLSKYDKNPKLYNNFKYEQKSSISSSCRYDQSKTKKGYNTQSMEKKMPDQSYVKPVYDKDKPSTTCCGHKNKKTKPQLGVESVIYDNDTQGPISNKDHKDRYDSPEPQITCSKCKTNLNQRISSSFKADNEIKRRQIVDTLLDSTLNDKKRSEKKITQNDKNRSFTKADQLLKNYPKDYNSYVKSKTLLPNQTPQAVGFCNQKCICRDEDYNRYILSEKLTENLKCPNCNYTYSNLVNNIDSRTPNYHQSSKTNNNQVLWAGKNDAEDIRNLEIII